MNKAWPVAIVCGALISDAGADGAAPASHVFDTQVGAGTIYEPDRIGSGHYQFFAVPVLDINYEDTVLISIDDGARYVAFSNDTFKAGPVIEFRPFGTDRLLPGRGSSILRGSVETGIFGIADLGFATVEARLRRALNEYDGWSGDLAVDTGFHVTDRIDFGFEARLGWADHSYARELFGVSADRSLATGLPEFAPGDYWSAGVEATVGFKLTDRVTLGVKVNADRLLGDTANSPRSRDDWNAGIGTSLTYRFSPRADDE